MDLQLFNLSRLLNIKINYLPMIEVKNSGAEVPAALIIIQIYITNSIKNILLLKKIIFYYHDCRSRYIIF
jgi:hypothetical protein